MQTPNITFWAWKSYLPSPEGNILPQITLPVFKNWKGNKNIMLVPAPPVPTPPKWLPPKKVINRRFGHKLPCQFLKTGKVIKGRQPQILPFGIGKNVFYAKKVIFGVVYLWLPCQFSKTGEVIESRPKAAKRGWWVQKMTLPISSSFTVGRKRQR